VYSLISFMHSSMGAHSMGVVARCHRNNTTQQVLVVIDLRRMIGGKQNCITLHCE